MPDSPGAFMRDERREAAARALHGRQPDARAWDDEAEEVRERHRAQASAALSAADAVTRPDWIVEAWKQEIADAEHGLDEARREADARRRGQAGGRVKREKALRERDQARAALDVALDALDHIGNAPAGAGKATLAEARAFAQARARDARRTLTGEGPQAGDD